MYHIIIHCKPQKDNQEFYGKVIGAYASVLIDYKHYKGVMELSRYYVEDNGWEIIEFDDQYFTFEKKEDLQDDYQQYFDEITEFGYTIIFNTYDTEDDE